MYGRRFALVLLILAACGDNRAAHMQDAGPDAPPDVLPPDGATEVCGNQVVDVGEDCDTGIAGLSADGCSSSCAVETAHVIDTNPPAMQSRWQYAIAYDQARHVAVMFGGLVNGIDSAPGTPNDETWEWNGSSWTQRLTATKPPALVNATMVFDSARQRIVLFGGDDDGTLSSDTWEYDGTDWTKRTPAHSPSARKSPGMAFDPARGLTVLVGGTSTGPLIDTWEWDGTDWTQRTDAPAPVAQRLITYAGSAGVMFCQDIGCDTMRAWDGVAWSTIQSPPNALYSGWQLAYDSVDGHVLALEGIGFPSVWEWDGQSWVDHGRDGLASIQLWTPVVFDPDRDVLVGLGTNQETWEWQGTAWRIGDGTASMRVNGAAAYDARRGVVVDMDPKFGTTWEWNGTDWVARTPAHAPPKRQNTDLAYDEARGVTVLYGGSEQPPDAFRVEFTDTWEWDGADWVQRSPQHHPPEAARVVTAYDAKRRIVLAYVGTQLWAWDGSDWTQIATTHNPGDIYHLAYDATRDVIVAMSFTLETWEWDGTDWTQRMTAHTPPRGGALVFDPLRQRTEMIPSAAGPIWEWDGTDWSPVTSDVPSAHGWFGVYDRIREEILFVPTNGRWEPWLYRWRDGKPRELCDGSDADGDGLAGCADPDCWGRCNPLCVPGTTCDASDPHCGDGTCSSIESNAICPADCP